VFLCAAHCAYSINYNNNKRATDVNFKHGSGQVFFISRVYALLSHFENDGNTVECSTLVFSYADTVSNSLLLELKGSAGKGVAKGKRRVLVKTTVHGGPHWSRGEGRSYSGLRRLCTKLMFITVKISTECRNYTPVCIIADRNASIAIPRGRLCRFSPRSCTDYSKIWRGVNGPIRLPNVRLIAPYLRIL